MTHRELPKYQIAISYASEDHKVATELANDLKNRDVSVFFDKFEKVFIVV